MRRLVRRLYYFPIDVLESIQGERQPLVPPKGKMFIGPGDFIKIGDEFLKNFTTYCNLRPESKILDVGCGIGRIARPLASYLNPAGSYHGFDIVKEGIDWCVKNYKDFSNFHFKYIALKNDLYNLNTQNEASEFLFPYPDQTFDLVILTSVFTHLQQQETKNYFKEISRVLKSGQYCFCTFFLITEESENHLNSTENPFFKYRYRDYFLHNEKVKDANIAYRFEFVKELARLNSLELKSYFPGWWAGGNKDSCLNFQDILILTKI